MAKARDVEARLFRQLDEELSVADVTAFVEDGLEEGEVVSREGLLPLKGCTFGGLGRGEAMVRKGLATVPGLKRPPFLLPMGAPPVPPSIIVEGDGRVGLRPKEEGPVTDADSLAVAPFNLFQPNGGIVAPRSAVIVVDEELQRWVGHGALPPERGHGRTDWAKMLRPPRGDCNSACLGSGPGTKGHSP